LPGELPGPRSRDALTDGGRGFAAPLADKFLLRHRGHLDLHVDHNSTRENLLNYPQ
jgi:hypothetical protein